MTRDNPINVRLRGEETKGRLALMENRVRVVGRRIGGDANERMREQR
jgi:hypothetical protein